MQDIHCHRCYHYDTGFQHVWTMIKDFLNLKADKNHKHDGKDIENLNTHVYVEFDGWTVPRQYSDVYLEKLDTAMKNIPVGGMVFIRSGGYGE